MMTIVHPIYMEKYLNQNILDDFTTTGFVCLFLFWGEMGKVSLYWPDLSWNSHSHMIFSLSQSSWELGVGVGEVYV